MTVHREIIDVIEGEAATIGAAVAKLREVCATSTERDLLIYVRSLLSILESPLLGKNMPMKGVRESEPCKQLLRYCDRRLRGAA